MRLLLVGAFPYPLWQGSQVYFQEQAIALRDAGAEVELLTYASGNRDFEGADRALAGFVHHSPPAWTAPGRLRSGPSWAKPMADLALTRRLNDALASSSEANHFDAVLTHHSEGALAGLWARQCPLVPRIYCVHTLLENELSAYLEGHSGLSGRTGAVAHRLAARGLDSAGRGIDRFLARRVDGWISLTQASGRVMRQYSNQPGARIAPPIPGIRGRRSDPEVVEGVARLDLEAGEYFLYSGNLDGYQEIPVLAEAAALLRSRASQPGAPPDGSGNQTDRVDETAPVIVVASHDAEAEARIRTMPGLTFRAVRSSADMSTLLRGARANLVMRRAEGGYPIKLANAHAAGTPSIVFRDREWGLTDGVDCLVAGLDRPAENLARAITRLDQDASLAERLGAGARSLHRSQHDPPIVAERTLKLIEQVIAATPAR